MLSSHFCFKLQTHLHIVTVLFVKTYTFINDAVKNYFIRNCWKVILRRFCISSYVVEFNVVDDLFLSGINDFNGLFFSCPKKVVAISTGPWLTTVPMHPWKKKSVIINISDEILRIKTKTNNIL